MNSSGRRIDELEDGRAPSPSSSSLMPTSTEPQPPTLAENLAAEELDAKVMKRRFLSVLVVCVAILGATMAITKNNGGAASAVDAILPAASSATTSNTALKASSNKKDTGDGALPDVYDINSVLIAGESGPSKSPSSGLHKPTWKPTVLPATLMPVESITTDKPVESKDVDVVAPTTITVTVTDAAITATSSSAAKALPARPAAGAARGAAGPVGGSGAVFDTPMRPTQSAKDGASPSARGASGAGSKGAAGASGGYDAPLRPAPIDKAANDASTSRGATGEDAQPVKPRAAVFDTPLRPVGGPADDASSSTTSSSTADASGAKGILPSWMTKALLQSGPAEMAFNSDTATSTTRRALSSSSSSSDDVSAIKDTIKALKKDLKTQEKAYKKAGNRNERAVIQDMIRTDEELLADAEAALVAAKAASKSAAKAASKRSSSTAHLPMQHQKEKEKAAARPGGVETRHSVHAEQKVRADEPVYVDPVAVASVRYSAPTTTSAPDAAAESPTADEAAELAEVVVADAEPTVVGADETEANAVASDTPASAPEQVGAAMMTNAPADATTVVEEAAAAAAPKVFTSSYVHAALPRRGLATVPTKSPSSGLHKPTWKPSSKPNERRELSTEAAAHTEFHVYTGKASAAAAAAAAVAATAIDEARSPGSTPPTMSPRTVKPTEGDVGRKPYDAAAAAVVVKKAKAGAKKAPANVPPTPSPKTLEPTQADQPKKPYHDGNHRNLAGTPTKSPSSGLHKPTWKPSSKPAEHRELGRASSKIKSLELAEAAPAIDYEATQDAIIQAKKEAAKVERSSSTTSSVSARAAEQVAMEKQTEAAEEAIVDKENKAAAAASKKKTVEAAAVAEAAAAAVAAASVTETPAVSSDAAATSESADPMLPVDLPLTGPWVRVTDADLAALKMAVEPIDSAAAAYSAVDSVDQRPKNIEWPEQVAAAATAAMQEAAAEVPAPEVPLASEATAPSTVVDANADADAAAPLRNDNPAAIVMKASKAKSSGSDSDAKGSKNRTQKPTHQPRTHTPKPSVSKTAGPTKTHKPTHLEIADVKVKQKFAGVSASDAKEKKFQTAVQGAVAKALGVSAKDVEVTGVSASGKSGVVLSYYVTGVSEGHLDDVQKTLASDKTAKLIQAKLKSAGYKKAVVGDADEDEDDHAGGTDDTAPAPAPAPAPTATTQERAVVATQTVRGVTAEDAGTAAFQVAVRKAVADRAGVPLDSVQLTSLTDAKEGGGVEVGYEVLGAEKKTASTLETGASAAAVQKELKAAGFPKADVGKAEAEVTTVDVPVAATDDGGADDFFDPVEADQVQGVRATQPLTGVSVADAASEEFTGAFKAAVAAQLGVEPADVAITAVADKGKATTVTYTVTGIATKKLKSAAKTAATGATAATVEKALQAAGFTQVEAAKADAEVAAVDAGPSSSTDDVASVQVTAVEATQAVAGVSEKQAASKDFATAVQTAVAAQLDVEPEDVTVDAVAATKDGVDVTYTVTTSAHDASKAAKAAGSSATAAALEKQLKKHGFSKADVAKADATVITYAEDVPALKVKATLDGASPADAQEDAFQTAMKETVAEATGLAAGDIDVVGVVALPCGTDDEVAPAPQAALPLLLFNHQRRATTTSYIHGCGGVEVQYVVHDTARNDPDLLLQIIESKTLAANLQAALTDAGYKGVAVSQVAQVVASPTPAPSVYCPEYVLRRGKDDPMYQALCAPTAAPTPAPQVAVTVAVKGLSKKCSVGDATGGAVASALGLNPDDVAVVKTSSSGSGDKVTLLINAAGYGLSTHAVKKELAKADTAFENAMAQRGCGDDVKLVSVSAETEDGTGVPTPAPTRKNGPTNAPTVAPATRKPSGKPSSKPTHKPTGKPSHKPTRKPSHKPTDKPQEVHHHRDDDEPAPLPVW